MAVQTSSKTEAVERPLPIFAFGLSLSAFLAVSFVFCIAGYLIAPGLPIRHEALSFFLPGFDLLNRWTYLFGLVESYLWGWYIAVVFGSLYNYFARRWP